jgi:hypothetical protein
MAAQEKRINELSEENKILMSEADRLIKEKGQLMKTNEEMKQLLCKLRPILRKAFFAHYEQTNKANELYDKITEIVGKE